MYIDFIISIVILVVLALIAILVGTVCSLTIMALILNKSNNLGAGEAIEETINGFVICKREDTNYEINPSSIVYNPVIQSHSRGEGNSSYLEDVSKMDIEDQINNADLSNIKWHN